MNKHLFLASALGLSLFTGCVADGSDPSLEASSLALVSVNADTLEALDRGETFAIDLRQREVIYEIDGASDELDLDQLSVITQASESLGLRDYLAAHETRIDEHDFFLRLAGDAQLLVEDSTLGSTSQALNNRIGGGGLGVYSCGPVQCECHGDEECNDMLGPLGPCHGDSWCDTSIPESPVCYCVMSARGRWGVHTIDDGVLLETTKPTAKLEP